MLTKVPIKHLARVGSGQGAPQRETDFSETGIPFIRAGSLEDLLNGMDEYELPKVNEEIAKEYRLKLYQPNTIVFAKSGMSALKGRIYKLKNPCYVVNHLATLELKENAIPDYVIYTLRYFSPVKLINDNAYPSLKQSVIENYEIPFPKDKDDQLHIANLLSKAENLIAQRKESIRLLDKFLKSTFLEMFGELENDTPLESFCVFSQGIQVPVEEQYSECKDGQVRFLRIIDFTQSDEPRYIDNLGERYFVSEDDISMVRYGASAGFVGYGKKGIIANNLFKFNFDKKKVLPVYLLQVLQSQRFKNYIKLKSTGSAMPALSFGMLNDYKISIPSIEHQTQFAQIVEKTEALKTQYQQNLQELENLYGSLSQKAFKGEFTLK